MWDYSVRLFYFIVLVSLLFSSSVVRSQTRLPQQVVSILDVTTVEGVAKKDTILLDAPLDVLLAKKGAVLWTNDGVRYEIDGVSSPDRRKLWGTRSAPKKGRVGYGVVLTEIKRFGGRIVAAHISTDPNLVGLVPALESYYKLTIPSHVQHTDTLKNLDTSQYNYLAYFSGKGHLDASAVYFDSGNNRVGIGTASPTSMLEVAGTTKTNGLTVSTLVGGLLGDSVLTADALGVVRRRSLQALAKDTLLTKTLARDTTFTKTLVRDTSFLKTLARDTTFTKTLVRDTSFLKTLARDTINIYTTDGTLTGNRVVTQGSDSISFTGSVVNMFNVGSNSLSVDGLNNRVGIGTASPVAKLQVVGRTTTDSLTVSKLVDGLVGDSVLTSDASGVVRRRSLQALAKDTLLTKTLARDTTFTKTLARDTVFIKTLAKDTSFAKTLARDTISIYATDGTLTGNRVVTQGSNRLSFTGSVVNMFNVGSNSLSVDGATSRVGIGTASPSAKLQVVGRTTTDSLTVSKLVDGLVGDSVLTSDASGVVRRRSLQALAKDTLLTKTLARDTVFIKTLAKDTSFAKTLARDTINIYTADGTLTGNRVVSMGDHNLEFTSDSGRASFNGVSIGRGKGNLESNTAVGRDVLLGNKIGNYNTALGDKALFSNTIGNFNVALGYLPLSNNTSGDGNVAIGNSPLVRNTEGNYNTAIGYSVLPNNTEGNNNIAIGYMTGGGLTTGSNNTILGGSVIHLPPDLSNNVIIADGLGNQRIRILGDGNTGIGTESPNAKLQVVGRTITDSLTIMNITSGSSTDSFLTIDPSTKQVRSRSVATIYTADDTLTGKRVVTQGSDSISFTGSVVNMFNVGSNSLSVDGLNNRVGIDTTSPDAKLHVNGDALMERLRFTKNIVIGDNIFQYNTRDRTHTNRDNIVVGSNALRNAYTSANQYTTKNNVVIGTNAAENIYGGMDNVLIGHEVMKNLSDNWGPLNILGNVAIGAGVLSRSTGISQHNTIIGHYAGDELAGFRNVMIGANISVGYYRARNIDDAIVIGTGIDLSQQLQGIDPSETVSIGAAGQIRIFVNKYGNVGIGTFSPEAKLHVKGNFMARHVYADTVHAGYVNAAYIDGHVLTSSLRVAGELGSPGGDAKIEGALAVTGNVYIEGPVEVKGDVKATSFQNTSDIRYKKDIAPISNALSKALQLRGVYYNWRTGEFPDKTFDTRRSIGFIAQEVEKVLPELVSTDKKGYKAMSYDKVTALLIEALKEQNATIEARHQEQAQQQLKVKELAGKLLQQQLKVKGLEDKLLQQQQELQALKEMLLNSVKQK